MSTFLPSQVQAFFPNSVFQKTEKEIVAAQIVMFLAGNGDEWTTVIEVKPFFEHTKIAMFPHPVYNDPFSNPILAQGCVNAVWALIEEGFLEWVEERASFKVTEKFIAFYRDYK